MWHSGAHRVWDILRAYTIWPTHTHVRIFRPISRQNDLNHAHTFCRKKFRLFIPIQRHFIDFWKGLNNAKESHKNRTRFFCFYSLNIHMYTYKHEVIMLVVKVENGVWDVGCIDVFKANKLIFAKNKNDLLAPSNIKIYAYILSYRKINIYDSLLYRIQ